MDREHWLRLKDVLGRTQDLPSEQRLTFIKETAGMDQGLFEELLSLLRDHDTGGDCFLEAGVDLEEVNYEGRRLGPYEIKTRIGSGGMGSVYLAHRADGAFDKQVAIKAIKPGMDTRAILARFRVERQILANLEHPNIAKLLDGGSPPRGFSLFCDGLYRRTAAAGVLCPAPIALEGTPQADLQGLQRGPLYSSQLGGPLRSETGQCVGHGRWGTENPRFRHRQGSG